MKKFLVLSLMLGTLAFVVPSVEAKSGPASVSADPQIRVQIGPKRNRRVVRSVVRTRTVRRGNGLFRETYRVTTNRNGRQSVQVISSVRIRRY